MRENKVTITEKRAIMKYEYKKVTGYDHKKFIENGHTMFEEDVLQRLKRLAYLEEQMKQANGVNTEEEALHIDSVMLSCPKCEGKNIMQRADGVIGCVDCFHSWRHEA